MADREPEQPASVSDILTETAQSEDSSEADVISERLLPALSAALAAGDREALKAQIDDLEDADVADVLTLLEPEQRTRLITILGEDFPAGALAELDWTVRDQLVEALPNATVAEAVRELDTDDAVYLIEDMAAADQEEILAALPADERLVLERSLDYPEDSAGRLMQSDVIAVPPFWSVGQVIDYMRETADLPDEFSQIFVVDPTRKLIGVVELNRLLRSKRPMLISAIMDENSRTIPVDLDQEEVARQFERYNLMSAAIVDTDGRLVGVVTADDVVEVVKEEAEEDIYRLAGVGDETVSDTVVSTSRSRLPWLGVNLLTAMLASTVISFFGATIDQMVALAVLMPICASMGGNAGTQTMTVAVRALATRDLSTVNAWRVILRESLVGLINGITFAVLIGLIAYLWFQSPGLGLVIASAMVINLLAAALAGILIPITLDRFGADPAVASGVFVTMVTDVVGFMAFLGLATAWLV